MLCKRCGKEIDDNADVCLYCGMIYEQPAQNDNWNFQQNNQPPQNFGGDYQQQGYGNPGQNFNQFGPAMNDDLAPRKVDFGEAIKRYFQKYATFEGRASVSEYWFAWLFTFLVGFVPFVGYVAMLAFLVPSIAVAVRRLHDTGKSGAYYFMILIPIAGPIIFLVQMCKESEPHDNQWGPADKSIMSVNQNNYNYNDNNYNGYNG